MGKPERGEGGEGVTLNWAREANRECDTFAARPMRAGAPALV